MKRPLTAALLLLVLAACTSPPPSDPTLRSGETFIQLQMAAAYTPQPPAGGDDEYRCVILDPEVTSPVFLTGVQYQPQDATIAHHAITYAVPPEDAATVRSLEAAAPGEGWTCFGMDGGVASSSWVDTWTPGGQETLFDGDMGYPLEPGSLLVVQIHYNVHGGHPAGPDRSGLRLRQSAGTPETIALDTMPLAAPSELPCAPGEAGPLCVRAAAVAAETARFGETAGRRADWLLTMCGYDEPKPGDTQTCDTTVRTPTTVYATRGHMHLLGRSISVELNPGTPEARMLLDVPAFDFDDQALHILPSPVRLRPGDTLRTSCTYDAGLRRQVPQLSELPPRYVVWGEGTADEMCAPLLTHSSP